MLFTINVETLATFYERVLDFRRDESHADHIILSRGDFRPIMHQIPAHIASEITMTSPPSIGEQAAVKLVFTVEDIAGARRLGPPTCSRPGL